MNEANGASAKAATNAQKEEAASEATTVETNQPQALDKDAEISRLQEQLKRVTAESQNFRRRLEGNFEKRIDAAKDDIFRKLLPVIDHLEMAVEAAKNGGTLESLNQGLELVLKDAHKVMDSFEVSAIKAVGESFDPSCHEAVLVEEREDLPDETISMELKKGYRIGERLLRPSLVKVARQPK